MKTVLILAFFFCAVVHLFQGVLFPSFTLLAFAPFLAFVSLRSPLKTALWLSLAAGLWVDLFSDDPFALHALNYTLVSAFFYRLRRPFSLEESLSFGLYTSFISATSTLLQLLLLFLFDRRVPISGKWILIDLTAMPAADGIYALLWISGPFYLFQKLRYRWVIYWLKNKKNLSRT